MNMRFILIAIGLSITSLSWGQGTTSSDMRGKVTDTEGIALIGAIVVAVHMPSGTNFGTVTDAEGNYQLPGMKVGGPYTVTVTYTGYTGFTLNNVILRLGETFRKDFFLNEAIIELNEVNVIASSSVTGRSAGTSTQISAEQIETVPSLDRDIDDFLRLTPQANKYGDGISFAGVNNRFNAIYIDGAVNNDVFGLASSGTNGGQTQISPFSMDIIDQFQIVLSPYDVSLGGFAGGGINAVTKSGTNQPFATAYYFTQNENLAGKTNITLAKRLAENAQSQEPDTFRFKLGDFSKNVYGASLGGALKKDKIFFFANVEIQNDITPVPFETLQYTSVAGRANTVQLDALKQHLIQTYGYDPGGFGSTSDELDGLKLFGKLDFNLTEKHRLTIRHQYTRGEQIDRFSGSSTTINFENDGVSFLSTTNSTAVDLNSRLNQSSSNNLIVGLTKVIDDRNGIGEAFPFVVINDADGTIRFGTDEFSSGSLLKQTTFSLTDNFKWYKGNHIFTFGTHNEFYSFSNVFIANNFGKYTFPTLEAFMNGDSATAYLHSYSLVDEVIGDETEAAAIFNAMQVGFYVQDEWSITSRFTLTGGLRLDIPVITSDPQVDTFFNNTALPKITTYYPFAAAIQSGKAPDGQLMCSPRLGFEFNVSGDRNTIIRGGLGVFTSRIPFVWPSAIFVNNGLTIGTVNEVNLGNPGNKVAFRPDVTNQYKHPTAQLPTGQVDIFVHDFKYPQVFRTNLGWDQKFDNGFEFSLEGLFTKTLSNIVYTNINSDPTVGFKWTGSGDNRSVFTNNSIESAYSAVYLGSNTSEGYTYNVTASLSKTFGSGFSAYIAYNYGDGKALNEGTFSQNSSLWRSQTHISGRNNPVSGRTDFAVGHRVLANLTYRKKWNKNLATSLSMFYNGESGEAFSYVIGGNDAMNMANETGSINRRRTLVYVPNDFNDIHLIDFVSGTDTITAQMQWENLNTMIESDKGLSEKRGQYVAKNGSFAPFAGQFDLVLRQDFGTYLGGDLHRIQISFDIFNVANLINNNWGVVYTIPGTPNEDLNNFQLYQFEKYHTDGTTPLFTYRHNKTGKEVFTIDGTNSRWRMRLGVRYILN